MFLERKTIGRLEGKQAFYFGASQGATALADAVSWPSILHGVLCNLNQGDECVFSTAVRFARCRMAGLPPQYVKSFCTCSQSSVALCNMQVKTIGADHPFTRLVPDLSNGGDPDDAFSRIPYECDLTSMLSA